MALVNLRGLRIFFSKLGRILARIPAHLQQQVRAINQKRRRSYRDVARRLFWQSVAYFFLVVPDAFMLVTVYYLCLWMRTNDVMYRMKTREFPLWYDPTRKMWYGPTAISHPKPAPVISSLHTAVALLAIPIAVFLLMQLRVRSFWDTNHAIWGLFKAVALMTLLEETFKRFITRPRPYFKPVWATISNCRNKVEPDAMQSFPSGHTGNSFAAAAFLALYLNAKLKAFSDYHTNFAKQMAIVAPLIGAGLIAAGMVVDRNHHATDVLLSILLGAFCALLAYRAQYRSLFDYTNNHLPQPYREPNSFTACFGPDKPPPLGPLHGTPAASVAVAAGADVDNHHRSDDGSSSPTTTTTTPHPDKYLAVQWPFPNAHKRGPVDTKKKEKKKKKENKNPQAPGIPSLSSRLDPHHDPNPVAGETTAPMNRRLWGKDVRRDPNSSANDIVWNMSSPRGDGGPYDVYPLSSTSVGRDVKGLDNDINRAGGSSGQRGSGAADAPSTNDSYAVGGGGYGGKGVDAGTGIEQEEAWRSRGNAGSEVAEMV